MKIFGRYEAASSQAAISLAGGAAGWWWLVVVQIANESSGHNWQAGGEEGRRMRTGPRIVLC